MRKKPFAVIGIFVVTGLLIFGVQSLYKLGLFKKVENFEGNFSLETLKTPANIADLDFDKDTKTIFISTLDSNNSGAIYSLNTDSVHLTPKNLTKNIQISEFNPQGISFLEISGQKFLFVINKRKDRNVILKFTFKDNSLELLNSYSSTDFSNPHDLLAVSENAFFITNTHTNLKNWQKKFSDYLQLSSGNVIYFENGQSTIVLDKIAYPTGIALFQNQIYISSTLGKYVAAYTPTSAHYHLKEIKRIKSPIAPGNLTAFQNKLYATGHPNLLALAKSHQSPSALLSIENDDVKSFFVDNGLRISAANAVLPVQDKTKQTILYVSGAFSSNLVRLSPK